MGDVPQGRQGQARRVRRSGEEGATTDRGPNAPTAPPGGTIYGLLVADGKADIFLTYCTGALEAQKQNAGQQIVALPDELAVGADYGLTVVTRASPQAYQFAMFILSLNGQRALATYGFAAPLLPP